MPVVTPPPATAPLLPPPVVVPAVAPDAVVDGPLLTWLPVTMKVLSIVTWNLSLPCIMWSTTVPCTVMPEPCMVTFAVAPRSAWRFTTVKNSPLDTCGVRR